MGRLDYFSVIIIAICVAAAAFLVYIGAKKVMNNGDKDSKIDELYNGVRTYDENGKESAYTIDEKDIIKENPAPARTPSTPTNTSTTPTNDEDLEYDFLEETPKKSTASTTSNNANSSRNTRSNTSSNSGGSSSRTSSVKIGDYMVLAGSFKEKANAEREAGRLRNLGFSNTGVERFDRGAYSVILVDRFSSRSSADKLKGDLAAKGIDSYVKLKQ